MACKNSVLVAGICQPVILFGLIAFLFTTKTENNIVAIILISIGVICGVLLAELIRREYGLEILLPEFTGPNEMDKKD